MPERYCGAPYAWNMISGRDLAQEEKAAIASFRYEHYFKHLASALGVNHGRHRVWSPHDEDAMHLTARNRQGELLAVGSGVSAAQADLPDSWADLYRFDRLAPLGLDKILIFSRLVEHPARRGSSLFLEFFQFCAASFTAAGYAHAIHYCAPSLVSLYERLGYRLYAEGRMLEGKLFRLPMLLCATDHAYLRLAHPAFLRAAGPHLPLDNPGPVLSALPELAVHPLCVREARSRLERVRSLLEMNGRENLIPDTAAFVLRKASLLSLRAGDQVLPPRGAAKAAGESAPDMLLEPPLLWFLLSGKWHVTDHSGNSQECGPGVFINEPACVSLLCLDDGMALLCSVNPSSRKKRDSVLPARYWLELAGAPSAKEEV